jgi:hypothetical protein
MLFEYRTRNKILQATFRISRGHRPPFTTAPVADSQRSSDPLLFTLALARIAKGDGCVLMFLRCDG